MEGKIFTYDKKGGIAFSNNCKSNKIIIFVNGLKGTLLSLPYISKLNNFCIKQNVELVIPQLHSMPNHQITSIFSDIEDLNNLVDELSAEKTCSIVLVGHSTGCNDVLLYLKQCKSNNIKGVVLQAPVSDTECPVSFDVNKVIQSIHDSNPENKYIETENGIIWLKERFLTLYEPHNIEDLFSSYLPDSAFRMWKDYSLILSVLSGKDQYCNKDMRANFELMGDVHVINSANHNLEDEECQIEFIECLEKFLKSIKFLS